MKQRKWQLIRRGDTYKGKFKKLENATGKTITKTSGTKLITVPKTAAGKVSTPVVKVPSTGQTVIRTVKTLPQTSVMKVVTGKNSGKWFQSKKVVVDAITSDSESEGANEDVNQISNEEVSDSAEEQSPDGEDPNEEQ